MKYYAIIVAGGSGSRMKSTVPKQFMLLNNLPILMHTIDAFYRSDLKPEIIVALNSRNEPYWKELCTSYCFSVPHQLSKGGNHRFESVKNALSKLEDDSIVAVHDAVRPLVSNRLITHSFKMAELQGSAVSAIKSRDSVRQLTGQVSTALKRDEIFLVQTPQTFKTGLLKRAYEVNFDESFTDDASVVERSGIRINIIEGEYSNNKITFPEDIQIAELLMKRSGLEHPDL